MQAPLLGFNGERLDPASGTTHLGNGYRAYNPVLMRFHCPDSFSPFGPGGIHPYAYCAGDPVNSSDPSGHLSWRGWLGIGLGVLGLGLAAFTAGSSVVAAGGVMSALETASAASLVTGTAGVIADVTAIASGATEELNPRASAALGWASMAFGLVGAGSAIGMRTMQISRSAKRVTWGWETIRDIRSIGYEDTEDRFIPILARRLRGYSLTTYTFVDTHDGYPRLNIVGHGHYYPRRGTAFIHLDNVPDELVYDGTTLAQNLGGSNLFTQYSCARTIVCNSARGGSESFAARFAQESGLPTTGYLGGVTTEGPLEDIMDGRLLQIHREAEVAGRRMNPVAALNDVDATVGNWYSMNMHRFGRGVNRPVYVLKRGVNYNPITYYPDGRRMYREY